MGRPSKATTNNTGNKVDIWAEYSSTHHPYEEIKKKAINDMKYGTNNLCYAYLSQHQKFTEEQIEEMAVITSRLFHMMDYDLSNQEDYKAALRIIVAGYDRDKQETEINKILYGTDDEKPMDITSNFKFGLEQLLTVKNAFPAQGIQDKLNWKDIDIHQDLSDEFRKKWFAVINYKGELPARTKNDGSSIIPTSYRSCVYQRPKRARKRANRLY